MFLSIPEIVATRVHGLHKTSLVDNVDGPQSEKALPDMKHVDLHRLERRTQLARGAQYI